MTIAPVVSVTDELIAELERDGVVKAKACAPLDTLRLIKEIRRLRAEVEALRADSARLDWMLSEGCVMECMNGTASPVVYRLYWHGDDEAQSEWYPSKRTAIDTAMQSDTEGN